MGKPIAGASAAAVFGRIEKVAVVRNWCQSPPEAEVVREKNPDHDRRQTDGKVARYIDDPPPPNTCQRSAGEDR